MFVFSVVYNSVLAALLAASLFIVYIFVGGSLLFLLRFFSLFHFEALTLNAYII
jgi:hypothetical protein